MYNLLGNMCLIKIICHSEEGIEHQADKNHNGDEHHVYLALFDVAHAEEVIVSILSFSYHIKAPCTHGCFRILHSIIVY